MIIWKGCHIEQQLTAADDLVVADEHLAPRLAVQGGSLNIELLRPISFGDDGEVFAIGQMNRRFVE